MADNQPAGWAIRRNGTCPANEVDCGESIDPFHVCCPSGSQCPDQYNRACCPQGGGNCTESLVQEPVCANSSWSLYTMGGYFCCDPGTAAFGDVNWVGCAQSGNSLPDGAVLLPVVHKGSGAVPTASPSSSTTPDAGSGGTSADSNKSASSSSSKGTNIGAIAGGVTGGVILGVLIVAGIWFWQRRSKSRREAEISRYQFFDHAPPSYEDKNAYGSYVPEVESKSRAPEADSTARAECDGNTRVELGNGRATTLELPAAPYSN